MITTITRQITRCQRFHTLSRIRLSQRDLHQAFRIRHGKLPIGGHISLCPGKIPVLPRRQKVGPILFRFNGLIHVPVRRIHHQSQILRGADKAHPDLCFRFRPRSFLHTLRGLRYGLLRPGFRLLRVLYRLHDGLSRGSGLLRSLGVRENRRHQLERHGDRHQQSQQFLHDATFFLYFRPVQRSKNRPPYSVPQCCYQHTTEPRKLQGIQVKIVQFYRFLPVPPPTQTG